MFRSFYNKAFDLFSKYKYYFLGLFFFVQYLLFRQYIHREILPVYPIAHDQVIYLNQAFEIYKNLQILNLSELFRIFQSLSTGIFLQFFAGFLYLFFGPSREAALNINFLFFIITELELLRFSKIFYKRSFPFLFCIGLLMTIPGIYHYIGGVFDFRFDFAAFCLNFIILLEILIFYKENKKFSKLYFITTLTTLFYLRTNSLIIYLFFGLLFFLLNILHKKLSLIKPLMISFVISLLLASPFIIFNIKNLYNYYYVGHVKGQEVIYRKAETNTFKKIDELLYYPKNLIEYQLTKKPSIYLFLLALYLFAFLLINKKVKKNLYLLTLVVLYGIAFFALYTADQAKSSVVGINLLIPIICIIYIFYEPYYEKNKQKYSVFILTIFVFAIGARTYFLKSNLNLGFSNNDSYLNVVKFSRFVNNQIKTKNLDEPIIATFYANELSERLLMHYYMYDNNEFKSYKMTLGNTLGGFLGAVTINQSNAAVRHSNIVIYNIGDWQPDWIPFNKDFKKIREVNDAIVKREFCSVGNVYSLPWGKVQLYMRPIAQIDSSGDWLLNNFNISFNEIEQNCLNKFNYLHLNGVNSRKDAKKIHFSAHFFKDGHLLRINNEEIILKNDSYDMSIPIKIEGLMPDVISISSNDYFVPSKISDSKDERKLLIFKPQQIILD